MRVVLSGYYGFHNSGDEAILDSLVKQLRFVDPEVHITVLSNDPVNTSKNLGVDAVSRKSPFGMIRAISRSDLLINGGGSLFQDETSGRSLLYYVLMMRIARWLGKKTASVSCGVGPIHSLRNRRLVKREIEKSEFTTLRDPDSYVYLKRMGTTSPSIDVSADLAMGFEVTDREYGVEFLKRHFDMSRPIIVLALREKDFRSTENLRLLIHLIEGLTERYDVMFLPFFHGEDTKLFFALERCADFKRRDGFVFVTERLSTEQFISVLSASAVAVGSRLHSLIFSTIALVPFVGVSYDPKIDAFLRMAKKTPICTMEHFSPERILEEVDRMIANIESERKRIAVFKDHQQISYRKNETYLRDVLKK